MAGFMAWFHGREDAIFRVHQLQEDSEIAFDRGSLMDSDMFGYD